LIEGLAAPDLHHWLADATRAPPLLLDVRQSWEFERCRIEGSLLIPLPELACRHGELPQGRSLVLICHHGLRSLQAAQFLERAGFNQLYNLEGGIAAWAAQVDPAMPRY